jgi:hypothetical protein
MLKMHHLTHPAGKAILAALLLLWAFTADAQKKKGSSESKDEYVKEEIPFVYNDQVYGKNIRTVQLHRSDWEFSQPIISLQSAEKLRLDFDDLDADTKTYNYTFIHCDADWQPSNIVNSDFMSGFYDEEISGRTYSVNTLQPYTHYTLLFPTENVQITRSGNYILKVYTDFNPDNVVLSRRFMVVDEKVTVSLKVNAASITADRNYKQELDFTITTGNYTIANPYGDLKVVLQQNGRWDNSLTGLKPVFVKDKELDYDFGEGNVFYGGSEFRRFDAKSLRYHTERIEDIRLDSATKRYKVTLLPDETRMDKRYTTEPDINGHFKVYIEESKYSPETEADYIYVHFFLKASSPEKGGDYYVFGEFADWQYRPEYKMSYDAAKGGYDCTAYLKQGYYNYEYIFLKDGESVGDESLAEGTHWETENDYTLLVYNRERGKMYDELICVKHKNSVKVN